MTPHICENFNVICRYDGANTEKKIFFLNLHLIFRKKICVVAKRIRAVPKQASCFSESIDKTEWKSFLCPSMRYNEMIFELPQQYAGG